MKRKHYYKNFCPYLRVYKSAFILHPLTTDTSANSLEKGEEMLSSSADNSSLDRDKKLFASFTFD